MTEYNTIIDIYDRLVDVSDKMLSENNPNLKGFNKCVFMLHYALKNYHQINLHLECKRLQRELDIANEKVLKLKATVTKLTHV